MAVAYIGLPPFIVTLGTYTAIRGAAYLAAGGTTVINSKIDFAWIGNGYLGPIPWLVIIALLIIAVSAFHTARYGLRCACVRGRRQPASGPSHRYSGLTHTDLCVWRQRRTFRSGRCNER